ncbi:UDP-N-acetylglucosamine 2-epimerase (non-hydrolyzing) [candidate division KSB1 bacterium]|nr:UDP-N-acetylglucosamine 2-epimerase (non-hydrolyzing) [candidate division KSB1 bacterium]NIR71910.1 UDP-N-acetylglucosamine 2-epimerase (non-hydrolyzing) [candidate division KSB1 bacterium]NIS23800.1 UDP-N-acetylglucosamine 2-epimerase (non-hydrolyzing) [candidate division KSB1 bacterium]NIT70723.1 UDP-N-acetylglucosamine 2-epimerase (non-hydrolyzing) [candidate division KSB1 bacterium]NIU24450.1 UDP-N-acetylglucosamine 2-epimerase (non-hydrolyzing) [candidate division KSB1 bacterium]
MKPKVMNVVGARPNFMKIAPLMNEFKKYPDIEATLLHTGQHYDEVMSKLFFHDLGIPEPDTYLGVGSSNHGTQTGRIMIEFEKVLLQEKPDLVIVVGDVNSTIACGLVAVKQNVKLAHVEAGLRSFDRSMPEEINRVLTDQISDFLFVTEKSGEENLIKEGIDKKKIFFVGNVMIDTLRQHLKRAEISSILNKLSLRPKEFTILTLHRPSNVDDEESLSQILNALAAIQEHIKIVFPIHPRSQARLEQFGLSDKINQMPQLMITEPLGYLDFLKLMSEAKFILTDSGGIQEETTVLGTPCLTLRENTERPVTESCGTNLVIGNKADAIVRESMRILRGDFKMGRQPDLWDGKAAKRIVRILQQNLR